MKKNNPRILVIEDNPVDITKIVMKLHKFSNDITYTTTGENGLSIIKGAISTECPYDILITDIILPGKDGKEIIKEVRNLESNSGDKHHIKIIAMSADEPSRHVLETCKVGAGCYIVKPVSEKQLIDALVNTGLIK